MQPTLAFAPTPDDLDDDLFVLPVLTFAPRPRTADADAPAEAEVRPVEEAR